MAGGDGGDGGDGGGGRNGGWPYFWTKSRGFWKLPIIIQSFKLTNHRVVPMILWVVASMVKLTNARHGTTWNDWKTVILVKTVGFVFGVQI